MFLHVAACLLFCCVFVHVSARNNFSGISLYKCASDVSAASSIAAEDYSRFLCSTRSELIRTLQDLARGGIASREHLPRPLRWLYQLAPRFRNRYASNTCDIVTDLVFDYGCCCHSQERSAVIKACKLRVIAEHEFKVLDTSVDPPKLLNTLAYDRAFFELHPGAMFVVVSVLICNEICDQRSFVRALDTCTVAPIT